jgi:transcriptional regulator with XRE-family HTH domain
MHRTYIYDIERGKYNVSIMTLLRLAKALGIPSSFLLAQLDPNDPLPVREAQEAGTSTTPVLTPDDQAKLLLLLGANIRNYRERKGLSLQALATQTVLTTSYIGQVERGGRNLTILNLMRIADALEFSVNHLLTVLDAYQTGFSPLPE